MSESADEADSKSVGSDIVWVQVPPPAPFIKRMWRNWQTHKIQVLVPKGVWVRVPSSVPIHFMLIVLFRQDRYSEKSRITTVLVSFHYLGESGLQRSGIIKYWGIAKR